MAPDQSDQGKSSVSVPSSLLFLDCVKLTIKIGQDIRLINKLWYIVIIEYYSVVKEINIHNSMGKSM